MWVRLVVAPTVLTRRGPRKVPDSPSPQVGWVQVWPGAGRQSPAEHPGIRPDQLPPWVQGWVSEWGPEWGPSWAQGWGLGWAPG